MDYNHINNFLEKFKTLVFKNEEANKIIAEAIEKYTKFPIEANKIKIKGTTININSSPIFKNEILIHKQKILSDLANLLPDKNFKDIR
ncbi:MAG TPA: hypothetical protein VMR49_02495 [Candidatus Paceibacterota bacterium]|jgi:hypothetical protein|nr:hypothetical protein [Candidatus Paceibacterota bacterium]